MCIPFEIRDFETDELINPAEITTALATVNEATLLIENGTLKVVLHVRPARMARRAPLLEMAELCGPRSAGSTCCGLVLVS